MFSAMLAAAIDCEFNAGDVRGMVGCKECHRCRDFVRFAERLRRDMMKQDLGTTIMFVRRPFPRSPHLWGYAVKM